MWFHEAKLEAHSMCRDAQNALVSRGSLFEFAKDQAVFREKAQHFVHLLMVAPKVITPFRIRIKDPVFHQASDGAGGLVDRLEGLLSRFRFHRCFCNQDWLGGLGIEDWGPSTLPGRGVRWSRLAM